MPVLSKEFLDIQATEECRFTLKHVCEMTFWLQQQFEGGRYNDEKTTNLQVVRHVLCYTSRLISVHQIFATQSFHISVLIFP